MKFLMGMCNQKGRQKGKLGAKREVEIEMKEVSKKREGEK
jgi:hypothetical protein